MDLEVTGQAIEIPEDRPHVPVLSSSFLDENAEFSDLKHKLESYRSESTSEGWKDVIHNSLGTLLSEVVFTKDKTMQLSLLSKVSNWYYEKIKSQREVLPVLTIKKATIPSPSLSPKTPKEVSKKHRTHSVERTPLKPVIPKFKAFAKQSVSIDLAMQEKLDKKYEEMRRHEKDKEKARKGKELLIQDWINFKEKRAQLLNLKLQLLSNRRKEQPKKAKPKKLKHLINFAEAKEDSEASDSNSETEDVNYTYFSSIGKRRRFFSRVIPIESERAAPRNGLKNTLSILKDQKPPPVKELDTPFRRRNSQLKEAINIKHKLAKTAVGCTIKDLELALVTPADASNILHSSLPRGGEKLPSF